MSYLNELTQQEREELDKLTKVVHLMASREEAPASSGNYSFYPESGKKATPPYIVISQSGVDKSSIGPDDFMTVDLSGAPTQFSAELNLVASAETLLHTMIYKNTSASCILHSHGPVGLVVVEKFLAKQGDVIFKDLEILKAFDGIDTHEVSLNLPVYSNSQDMPELSHLIEEDFKRRDKHTLPGFYLRGHGLYVWGRDVFSTRRHLEAMNYLFTITYQKFLLNLN